MKIGENGEGKSQYADFRLDDLVVECHYSQPIVKKWKRGDYESAGEHREFFRKLHQLELPQQRASWVEVKREQLHHNYFETRVAILNRNPELRNCHLILITDVDDLYRFMRVVTDNLPSKYRFMEDFKKLFQEVEPLGGKKRRAA